MLVPTIYTVSWRDRYASSRYLEHLSLKDLGQRYADLLSNVLCFRRDGRPEFRGLDEDTAWTRRIADVLAEVDLRGVPFGSLDAMEEQVLRRPYPHVLRALEAWNSRNPSRGSYIVKYGRRDDMVALIERGAIRVAPASSYSDPSLNPAIHDTELEFPVHFPPGTRLQREDSGAYEDVPGIVGLITFTRKCDDFFVFCASEAFDPRMFDDFGYDACVLIKDWQRFVDTVSAHPVPASEIAAASTVYVDPFLPRRSAEVALTKHLRYAYQREWRIVWTKPLAPPPLTSFFLELGDLRAYCELIIL